jgi:hypothetical protein
LRLAELQRGRLLQLAELAAARRALAVGGACQPADYAADLARGARDRQTFPRGGAPVA